MRALLVLVLPILLLSGCGQKGDLYIPESGSTLQAQSMSISGQQP
ncbi:lipoprotein [Endozoicomonas sp. Mp262]